LGLLRPRAALLVLDNFEHLLDGAELLADILAAAPAVKLLVTSREALALQQEWRYPVQGLPYPERDGAADLEDHAAVQLFVERAGRVRRGFALAEERDAVARICRLAEGMPLALELAAAWTSALPCAEIARELEAGLDLLATRLRDVPARHRSMQAVFEQSWTRLADDERAVLRRLSVFRGGFRREAAEAVAGASRRTLLALVDQSLVRLDPDDRYRLHTLLQQYAAEHLADEPAEAAHVRDRHGAYYVELLLAFYDGLIGGGQVEALQALVPELDDIRAAWPGALDRVDPEVRRRAVHALALGCDFWGRYYEGVALLEQVVANLRGGAAESGDEVALTAALVDLGRLYARLGSLDRAGAVLEEGQALYDRRGTPLAPGLATDPLFWLGWLAWLRGDFATAARLGEAARGRAEAQGHAGNLPYAWYLVAGAAHSRGDRAARRAAQQARAAAQASRDRWFMANCLNQLGGIDLQDGDHEAARRHYQASYDLRAEFGDTIGMALALTHLSGVDLRQGNYAAAQARNERARAIFEESGDAVGLTRALRGLGIAAAALGEPAAARSYFARALRLASDHRFIRLLLDVAAWTADFLLRDGSPELAVETLALVCQQPAADADERRWTSELLTRAGAGLGAAQFTAAVQRGRTAELAAVVARLHAALTEPPADEAGAAPPPQQPLVEPLSERELEVLRLLAEGRSNPEIAQELIIAVGTVKTHVHNICGKLGASTRGRAVARARELSLLPPTAASGTR
ncbi:MAG: tetratricopeptide repeat protein, partial [Chloroflexota bacterium]